MNGINRSIQRVKQKAIAKNVQLNPAVSLGIVREFEQDNGILFPQELVYFYSFIGNGGTMLDGFPLKRFEELDIDVGKAKEEFPFTEHWIWESDPSGGNLADVAKGNIELIDIGCAQTWNIIIAGQEYGQMWFFVDVGIHPCVPRRGFLSWYEHWLDGNDDYFSELEH